MHFQVDLDELSRVMSEMQGFERSLRRRLAELESTIENLHMSWTGSAADAHRRAHAELAAGAEEVHRSLSEMREAGEHAHAGYSAAAEANATMWSQVR